MLVKAGRRLQRPEHAVLIVLRRLGKICRLRGRRVNAGRATEQLVPVQSRRAVRTQLAARSTVGAAWAIGNRRASTKQQDADQAPAGGACPPDRCPDTAMKCV